MESKICKGCKLKLPVCRFNNHSATKDGLRSKCIECRRLEQIEYRQKNPEKIKELYRVLDERKRNDPKSVNKKRIRNKIYNSTKVGKIKNKIRLNNWKIKNKDKYIALRSFRRAYKKNATPNCLTKDDRKNIIEFFTVCQMFKLYTGQEYHVDHIVPLVNENICGLHVPWNLQILSAFDNLSKSNKFDESLGIDYFAEAYH